MAKTVLIVDDNDLNRRLFNAVLTAEGYRTLVTDDGRRAPDLAREHLPDLIVMDICMPETDGLAATRMIRADARTAAIPIVAVTAWGAAPEAPSFRAQGCDDFLRKPIDIGGFLDCVDRLTN